MLLGLAIGRTALGQARRLPRTEAMRIAKLYNLARMKTSTVGSGTVTLDSAVKSFLSFAEAGAQNGDLVTYAIEDGNQREIGRGVYSSAGPTLTREVLKSTVIDDQPLNLSGTAQVRIAVAAEDIRAYRIRGFSTGDTKLTFKTEPDPGWVMMDDGTIGDASSGANTADNRAEALFKLFFDNMIDGNVPLQESDGTATTRDVYNNATDAWEAHCRLVLPKLFGRALAAAGAGAGLTVRDLGEKLGVELRSLDINTMTSHTHRPGGGGAGHPFMLTQGIGNALIGLNSYNLTNYIYNTSNTGASEPFSIMNPTNYLNVMICL